MAGGNWTAAGLAIPITQVIAGCSLQFDFGGASRTIS
jgi:hypothetical protein